MSSEKAHPSASYRALEQLACLQVPEQTTPGTRMDPIMSTPSTRKPSSLLQSSFLQTSTPALGGASQGGPTGSQHQTPQGLGLSAHDASGQFHPLTRSPLANVHHSFSSDPDSSSGGLSNFVDSPQVPGSQASAHVHFASSSIGSAGPSSLGLGSGSRRDPPGLTSQQEVIFRLAKSLFDNHEIERCAWTLEKHGMTDDRSQFLRLYAKFLVSPESAKRPMSPVLLSSSLSLQASELCLLETGAMQSSEYCDRRAMQVTGLMFFFYDRSNRQTSSSKS